MAVFQKTAQAEEDLIDIWLYIAQDNPDKVFTVLFAALMILTLSWLW